MNTYSLASDSRRWWWSSAIAGSAGAAAIAAILVLPAAVQAEPERLAPAEPAGSVVVGDTRDRPCFLVRGHWNQGLDGFQPLCSSGTGQPAVEGVRRAGLGFLP